jgi:hypothetical protein
MTILKFDVVEKGPPSPVFNSGAGRPSRAATHRYTLCNGETHIRVILSFNIFAKDRDPDAIQYLGKCDGSCKGGTPVDPASLPDIVPPYFIQ